MKYSRKGFWLTTLAIWAVLAVFLALIIWLRPERPMVRPQPIVGLLAAAVSFISLTLALRAFSYRDEIQRQTGMRCWFFGSQIGAVIAGLVTVSIFAFGHPTPRAIINVFSHVLPMQPVAPFRYGFGTGFLTLAFAQVIGSLLVRAFLSLPKRES
jgi:hypothetical protein